VVDKQKKIALLFGLKMLLLVAACMPLGVPLVLERSPIIQSDAGSYAVRQGDTLYSISWRLGVDFRELASLNQLEAPYNIYKGQVLRTVFAAKNASMSLLPERSVAKNSRPKDVLVTKPQHSKKNRSGEDKKSTPQTLAAPGRTARGTIAPKKSEQGKFDTWSWPVKLPPTSRFGSGNKGLDFNIKKKQQIVSAGKGTVVYAGNGIAGFERLIIVKHSESLLSAYSFNGRIITREQRNVTVNDILGEILPISTKREVFHFELRRNGQPVNPEQVLPKKVS
jgi:lipoprotein NlpD